MLFGLIKKLQEELKWLQIKYDTAQDIGDLYRGWTFAYREAIYSMCQKGSITEEQRELFFDEARKCYNIWQTRK